ncbi:class I SAM-dependent methyltransferase [Telmatobacter bradus]|uniref:class I SAM-dependent methyltransferase n=1 Tax=Telmatobacter bradus TaxID=474953 RepID=UPI003B42A0C0
MKSKDKEAIVDLSQQTNHEQKELWNGHAGRAWAENQQILDQMFKPFEKLLVDVISSRAEGRILDIGCGAGSTTLAIARLLGTKGHCIGIDISAPLIEVARSRAVSESSSADFICADAQTHAFEMESFDTIISRFGVMFFGDPVLAFANLRRAGNQSTELRFIAWRDAAENPFMATAEHAAAPYLPNLPARRRCLPGQFAFADRNHINSILKQSGWADIDIQPINVTCTMPEKELVRYLAKNGPVGLMLQEAEEQIRNQVLQRVRAAFDPYVYEDEVRFRAACWMVSAHASCLSAIPNNLR